MCVSASHQQITLHSFVTGDTLFHFFLIFSSGYLNRCIEVCMIVLWNYKIAGQGTINNKKIYFIES